MALSDYTNQSTRIVVQISVAGSSKLRGSIDRWRPMSAWRERVTCDGMEASAFIVMLMLPRVSHRWAAFCTETSYHSSLLSYPQKIDNTQRQAKPQIIQLLILSVRTKIILVVLKSNLYYHTRSTVCEKIYFRAAVKYILVHKR